MAFLTQGGSQVGSSQIVDGAIVNADINAAAQIEWEKMKDLADDATDRVNIAVAGSTPVSLTTVAGERVLVIAKAVTAGAITGNVQLQYGGVQKDIVTYDASSSGDKVPITLMYSEVPGAATADIAVVPSAGSLAEIQIAVIRLKLS